MLDSLIVKRVYLVLFPPKSN